MATFNIPKENVLRHKDIRPKRKTDIADIFWNNKYKSWKDYQNSLVPLKLT
jgi:N-acetyl-anhydromuramyl-L-alanine amidase AmpD